MDKSICREQLGWNKDDFIVSFLGSFNDRKGVNRLSEAIRLANKKARISACFIGNGAIKPDCPNIVFCGTLDHDMIPAYLCASDVFVLPTLHEGCCNAIVEALACGIYPLMMNCWTKAAQFARTQQIYNRLLIQF